MAMTPDEESCRCVTARGAATLEAAMQARVAMGAVLVASILLDEIMLLCLSFSIAFCIMSMFDLSNL